MTYGVGGGKKARRGRRGEEGKKVGRKRKAKGYIYETEDRERERERKGKRGGERERERWYSAEYIDISSSEPGRQETMERHQGNKI